MKKARRRRGKLAKKAAARTKEFDLDGLASLLRAMLDQLALRAKSPSATYELLAELTFDRVLIETRRAFPKLAHLPRADELHRFRVRVKRLRYAAELVEPVLGQRFDAIHARAKKIQDVLGDHQDRVVLGDALERHRDRIRGDRHPLLVTGLDRLALRVRGEREQLFQRFNAEYGHVSGPHLFAR
jgi:CHAD domain-containing protein